MTDPIAEIALEAYRTAFQMPLVQTMVRRKSSITNAFVNSLLPVVTPTLEEIRTAIQILGMTADNMRCAYCGDRSTEWDHLRPLVLNQRPTGYVSEIANLVPCCGKCNQSKQNKPWREWMLGASARSPKTRKVEDLPGKVARLEEYERWRVPIRIDFESTIDPELWDQYWDLWAALNHDLARAQEVAESIRKRSAESLGL
jgi:hypothetical protein